MENEFCPLFWYRNLVSMEVLPRRPHVDLVVSTALESVLVFIIRFLSVSFFHPTKTKAPIPQYTDLSSAVVPPDDGPVAQGRNRAAPSGGKPLAYKKLW